MEQAQDTGLSLATELNDAIRRFNVNAIRAKQTGMPFRVKIRHSEQTRSSALHLDLLEPMPALGEPDLDVQDDRCAAWIDLLSVAAEVNRLIDKAQQQNVKVVLRADGRERTADERHVRLAAAM